MFSFVDVVISFEYHQQTHPQLLATQVSILREKFWKKFISSLRWTYKTDRNKAGRRKLRNTTLRQNDEGLLCGLKHNALASLVHFAQNKVNYRDASALSWRPERRRPPLLHSSVVLMSYLIPALFLSFFIGPSLTWNEPFLKTLSHSSCPFLRVFKNQLQNTGRTHLSLVKR